MISGAKGGTFRLLLSGLLNTGNTDGVSCGLGGEGGLFFAKASKFAPPKKGLTNRILRKGRDQSSQKRKGRGKGTRLFTRIKKEGKQLHSIPENGSS